MTTSCRAGGCSGIRKLPTSSAPLNFRKSIWPVVWSWMTTSCRAGGCSGIRRPPGMEGAEVMRSGAPLLDRHAFGEVAGLVDIGAFEHRGVVGEELHRDRVEQRRNKRRALRHRNAKGAALADPRDAGRVGDHHDLAAAGADLLDIREGLFEQR